MTTERGAVPRRPAQEQRSKQHPVVARARSGRPSPPETPAAAAAAAAEGVRPLRRAWRKRFGLEQSAEQLAEKQAKRLKLASEVLLERLFSYLSKLPEEDDDSTERHERHYPGITLPASAVGWLSSQLYCQQDELDDDASSFHEQDDETLWMGVTMRDRLSLLKFLLPRATHIRITNDPWPPESLPSKKKMRRELRRRTRPLLGRDLNCSTLSVDSGLTTDSMRPRPTLESFLHYVHKLQYDPRIDFRVFPNARVVVLDRIPPTWVKNLHALQHSLQVLRVERGCVYNVHSLLFPKTVKQTTAHVNGNVNEMGDHDPLSQPPEVTPTIMLGAYRELTHLKLSHCGIGELSGLKGDNKFPPLSRLPKLVSLSLSYNELLSESQALSGLKSLSYLTKLDLSFNSISTLDKAYTRLGCIKTLVLTGNQLTSAKGIDRLYALEELWLDQNQIEDLAAIAGLSRLPELSLLCLKDNPLEQADPKKYRVDVLNLFREQRVGSSQESSITYRQLQQSLPVLDGKMASNKELVAMRERTFPSSLPLPPPEDLLPSSADGNTHSTATTMDMSGESSRSAVFSVSSSVHRHRRVKRGRKTRKAQIGEEENSSRSTKSTSQIIRNQSVQESSSGPVVVSFSVKDVLSSLSRQTFVKEENLPMQLQVPSEGLDVIEQHNFCEKSVGEEDDASRKVETQETALNTANHRDRATSEDKPDTHPAEATTDGHEAKENRFVLVTPKKNSDQEVPYSDLLDNVVADPSKVVINRSYPIPADAGDLQSSQENDNEEIHPNDSSNKTSSENPKSTASELSVATNDGAHSSIIYPSDDLDPPLSFKSDTNGRNGQGMNVEIVKQSGVAGEKESKPKVATIKLNPGANGFNARFNEYDIFGKDWDELVRQASEGLIPDGNVRNQVSVIEKVESRKGNIFSAGATQLLAPATNEYCTPINRSAQVSLNGESQSEFSFRPSSLPEHVWQDDISVPSSLDNREDFPKLNKFQLAEENSEFDGPVPYKGFPVLSNVELYFSSFIFPSSMPNIPQSLYEELVADDNWQMVSLRYPRIQLWPEDRRWLETASTTVSRQISELIANRERFFRVWEEEILPCGKPALRRLSPNRNARLGFHGDLLFLDGNPDPYSACRNVILCLSTSAFYIIVGSDKVTSKPQDKKKKFPLPLPSDSFFRDAPWPHAVARHSFQDLQGITIGFGFQRLTLRFSNPAIRNTDPFTYVLLTSNKMQTISLLQDFQRCVKEAHESPNTSLSNNEEEESLSIENDDRVVLDALAAAVAPETVGLVLHYQVLHQKWKHGDRGTIRRVCVVTDTKMFLLDEDYIGDGSKPLGINSRKIGDVTYKTVDEATLPQISEVQGAGADPKAITIVINPLSRLSRTRRWRLICRDSEGAERLVEDVRKAIALEE
jgi:hypothetical protein